MDESLSSDVDRWITTALKCQFLPEKDLKVNCLICVDDTLFNALPLCALETV